MDNMRELEKRWYFYRVKKNLLFLNSFAFVVMLGLGSYYAFTKVHLIENTFNAETLLVKSEIETPKLTVEPILVAKPIENVIKSIEPREIVIASKNESIESSLPHEVSLEPIIPIVDMEKEERKSTHRSKYRASSTQAVVRAKPSAYLTASELATINGKSYSSSSHSRDTRSIKKINLNGTSDKYIETIKKKFASNKQPREALLLAKAFYAEKNYNKSEDWALKANKLDSNLEESWYLFAKSKAKLGQKSEAIKILTSYYKQSHSPKAKALIIKIKSERL